MKVVVYTKYGTPEVLILKEVEKPIHKDNEVHIKMYATMASSGDIRIRKPDSFIARFVAGFFRPKRTILAVDFRNVNC